MKTKKSLLLILLLLVIIAFLIYPFSFDYATSVVPGWHTTILPPYFIAGIIVTITLLTDYFIFMKLTKINSITPKKNCYCTFHNYYCDGYFSEVS
jgi:hypothetical protein